MQLVSIIINLVFSMAAFLVVITVHEYSHGRVAYMLGDPTAKQQGRLSLNPIKHLDPLGTLMLLITAFYGRGLGWAKPVPINPYRFRNPRRDMVLTSLAGPAANFVTAFILAKLMYFSMPSIVILFIQYAIQLNIVIGIFNLIPIPPLDGSKIIPALLPDSMQQSWFRFEQYGMAILLVLVFLLPGMLASLIFTPAGYILQLVYAPLPVPSLM